ncbi:AAA family ATPase [Methanotorris formicicus]|uniref:AAA family ATPase n=1 Tax=Methanotorris formicicus TaxID=213185 RepID=UPI003A4E2232
MIIREIKMKNFKSHVNSRITFKEGISVIVGHNGSGKSSIFDAVHYALFRPRLRYEDLVTRGRKNLSVELTFEVGGKIYRVVRERGNERLYANDELIAKGSNEVTREIKNILGIDEKTFTNSIYIKQGEIAELIHTSPAERERTIAKLLGIGEYQKSWETMREVINNFEGRLSLIEGELKNKEKIEKDIMEKSEELEGLKVKLEKLGEEFNNLNKKLIDKKKELEDWDEIRVKFIKFTSKLEKYESDLKGIENEIKKYEDDLQTISNVSLTIEENKEKYNQYLSIKEELENVKKSLNELKGSVDKYNKLIGQKENIKNTINKLETKISNFKYGEDLEYLNSILESLNKKIKKFEEIKEAIRNLKQINEKLDGVERHKQIISENKKSYEKYLKLEDEKNDLEKMTAAYTTLKEKYNNLIDNLKNLDKKKNELLDEISRSNIKEIEKKVKEINNLEKQMDELLEEKNKIQESIGEVKSKINALKKALSEIEKVRGRCPVCSSEIDEKKKKELKEEYSKNLKEEEERLKDLNKRLLECSKEIEELNNKLSHRRELKEKLGTLEEKINQLNGIMDEIKKKENEKKVIEEELSKFVIDGKSIEDRYEEVKNELNNLKNTYTKYLTAYEYLKDIDENKLIEERNRLEGIIGDYDIDTCNSSIENTKSEIDKIKELIRLIEERKKLKEDLKDIENKILALLGHVGEYKEKETKFKALERKLKEIEVVYEKYRDALAILQNLSHIYKVDMGELKNHVENLLNEKLKEKSEILERIEVLNNKLRNLNYDEKIHNKIKNDFKELEDSVRDKEKELVECKTNIENVNQQLEELNNYLNKLKEKERERERLLKFIEYLDKVRDVFSRDGFQRYLREKYKPLIQKYTNEAFEEFDLPYTHIELTHDFDIKVHSPNGTLNVGNLSGGEQIAVALALRLGIAKVLIGSRIECIILDEPTVYLDEERRKKLVDIFKSIRTIPQMILITHHPELEQIADTLITVRKEGGVSKVSIN